MRFCLTIAVVTLSLATSLSAQNIRVRLLDFSFIPYGDRINEINCVIPTLPSLPTDPAQVLKFKQGDKIVWCVDSDWSIAESFEYLLQVDSEIPINVQEYCSHINPPVICVAAIPASLITVLQQPKDHVIAIRSYNAALDTYGQPSTVNVRRPVCVDQGITYEVGAPLLASSPGALRNQMGMFTLESRIGQLREAGFEIIWQRVQFGIDSTGLNGYNYLMAWCVGK